MSEISRVGNFQNNPNNIKKKTITTRQLASIFHQLAKKHTGAVSTQSFQKRLGSLSKDTVISLIKEYDNLETGESFVEMIGDEVGDSPEIRKSAIQHVLDLLLDKASEHENIDIEYYKEQLNNELDNCFKGFTRFGINTKKLDSIINTLIISIESQSYLTPEDKEKIKHTSSAVMDVKTTNLLLNRYNKAVRNYNDARENEGWTGRVADSLTFWGDKTAAKVLDDFKIAKEQIDRLKDAIKTEESKIKADGSKNKFMTYAEEFKDIFKIDYNPANIVAYKRIEAEYIFAAIKYENKKQFALTFSRILKEAKPYVEYSTITSPTTGVGTTYVSKTKEQTYEENYQAMADKVGNEAILNMLLEDNGVNENSSLEEKYDALRSIILNYSSFIEQDLNNTLNGQTFEQVEAKYENSYKAAFGHKNEILKRVMEYNISQQKAAGLVRSLTAIGATMLAIPVATAALPASAGAGAVIGLSATVGAGVSAVVDVSDEVSKPKIQEAFKKGFAEGISEIDYKKVIANSLMAGFTIGTLGATGHGVTILAANMTPAIQAAARFGVSMAMLEGMEFVMTGEVSIEGFVFNILLSSTGEIIAFKATQTTIAKAKQILNISENAEITPELLKSKYIENIKKSSLSDKNISEKNNFAAEQAYIVLRSQTAAKTGKLSPRKVAIAEVITTRLENLPHGNEKIISPDGSVIEVFSLPQTTNIIIDGKIKSIQDGQVVMRNNGKLMISNVSIDDVKTYNKVVAKAQENGSKKNIDRIDGAYKFLTTPELQVQMRQYSEKLANEYAEQIESGFKDFINFMSGSSPKITKDKNFYKYKDKNAEYSARSKSVTSIYSKIKNRILNLKNETPTNIEEASFLIGDAGGIRYTLKPLNKKMSEKIISNVVPRDKQAAFRKYYEESYMLTEAEKRAYYSEFYEYEKTIHNEIVKVQSERFVDRLCEGIESGEIDFVELNNYCGYDGMQYFSENQVEKIKFAYNKWFAEKLKLTDIEGSGYEKIIDSKSNRITGIKDKDGNIYDVEMRLEDSMKDSSKIKESGYTSAQINIIGKNGLRIEVQYRASEINKNAEYEHMYYDLCENKETVQGSIYAKHRKIYQEKMKDAKLHDKYKKYLTQIYNYSRRLEMGLPVGKKPALNPRDFPNLTRDDLEMISIEGLKRLYKQGHK